MEPVKQEDQPVSAASSGPPNFDPFGVSPNLDPALTARQFDAINRRATLSEWRRRLSVSLWTQINIIDLPLCKEFAELEIPSLKLETVLIRPHTTPHSGLKIIPCVRLIVRPTLFGSLHFKVQRNATTFVISYYMNIETLVILFRRRSPVQRGFAAGTDRHRQWGVSGTNLSGQQRLVFRQEPTRSKFIQPIVILF